MKNFDCAMMNVCSLVFILTQSEWGVNRIFSQKETQIVEQTSGFRVSYGKLNDIGRQYQ
jgi:hypothetical protein